jgi:hypothetical protein
MNRKYAFIGFAVIALMLSVQVQALGVTRPVPYDIQLQKGEKAGFVFEIQAVTSSEKQLCSYSITGLAPIQVAFEESEAIVDAGSIKNVYGTVTIPESAETKTYQGSLTVSCGAYAEGQVSGSIVKTTVGGSPFNIRVVEVRSQDIRNVAPPIQEGISTMEIMLIIAIIIIIVVIIGVYYKLRRHKKWNL